MYERDEGAPGDGGGGRSDHSAPRASVALTADQWSAVTLAISYGVSALRDSKKVPIQTINSALRDIADATQEISRRLGDEAQSRAKRAK